MLWLPPAAAGAKPAQPGVCRRRSRAHAVRARRPRDLVLRDRRQRPLPHLRLSAAARRRDRLVRHPERREPRPALPHLGPDQRSRLLRAGQRRTAPRTSLERDLRLRLVPGRRRPAGACRQDRLPRSGLRLRGRALDARAARTVTSTSAQSACGLAFGTSTGALGFRKFPNPRFDARGAGSELNAARWRPGKAIAPTCAYGDDAGRPGHPQQPPVRRLDRAAVPDRHGLRRLPHRVRSAQPAGRPRASGVGEHQRHGRQSVPAHLRDAGLGHAAQQPRVADLRARPARARSTPRPCRTTS